MIKKIILFAVLFTALVNPLFAKGEVTIYTYRQPFLLKPLLEAFEKKTGIKTNTLFLKVGLNERLLNEGKLSPADLILTVDVSRLNELVEKDLVQPVSSSVLNKYVPKNLRHSKNLWFAQSLRARVIFASKKNVPKGSIQDYQVVCKCKLSLRLWRKEGLLAQ